MAGRKTADPIDTLAVGVAADHAAKKARGELDQDTDLAGEGPDPTPAELAAKAETVAVEPHPDTPEGDRADLDGGINTDAIEGAAERAELDLSTMVGDVRDTLMEVFKHRPKPWSQMLAGEQRDVAQALEYAARKVVQKAVQALAAADRPNIKAVFKGYSDKAGELTGTVKFVDIKDEDVLALHRASGKSILLVVSDAQEFGGQRRDADVAQDEPDMFEADMEGED